MNRCLQGFAATLVAAAIIFTQTTPATAAAEDFGDRGAVNVVFDAMVLRPMGMAVTALGGMLFAFPVAPIVAVTRVTDIRKPLDALVLRPARYTFVDPLGHH
jgi:hypothetical protein